jgi:mannose-1-phosphate guanylyltransferase/mannose-6-phosphate isomerase
MSRKARPKQFLALDGKESLLRRTWRRARRLAPPSRIWVVTPRDLAAAVRREIPLVPEANFIIEPSAKDTGPALVMAAEVIRRRDPSAIVGVFPTDHLIRNERALVTAFGHAVRAAAGGALVCLGVVPDRPHTGYGYVRLSRARAGGGAIAVTRFIEKPELALARRFVASKRYLWNGGMFVWRASEFLSVTAKVAPAMHAAGVAAAAGKLSLWRRLSRASVDRAVMEKAPDVAVVPLDAGWEDLGSWDAVSRSRRPASASVILLESPGTVVFDGGRIVAVLGVPDVVVVDTPDALLIASRGATERVRGIVDEIERRGRGDVL